MELFLLFTAGYACIGGIVTALRLDWYKRLCYDITSTAMLWSILAGMFWPGYLFGCFCLYVVDQLGYLVHDIKTRIKDIGNDNYPY